MADKERLTSRNPAEIQLELLLEAQCVLGKRLTAYNESLDSFAEALVRRDRDLRRIIAMLYADMDDLAFEMLGTPVPRRCSHCFNTVTDDLSSCPGCLQAL